MAASKIFLFFSFSATIKLHWRRTLQLHIFIEKDVTTDD